MVSKARKNRVKKKEVPQDKWNNDLQSIVKQYSYGGKNRGENQNSEERRQ